MSSTARLCGKSQHQRSLQSSIITKRFRSLQSSIKSTVVVVPLLVQGHMTWTWPSFCSCSSVASSPLLVPTCSHPMLPRCWQPRLQEPRSPRQILHPFLSFLRDVQPHPFFTSCFAFLCGHHSIHGAQLRLASSLSGGGLQSLGPPLEASMRCIGRGVCCRREWCSTACWMALRPTIRP